MANEKQQAQSPNSQDKRPICGIVMPISAIDDCSANHWEDVKTILCEAIEAAGYAPNLVSDANDSGIIQKRIVQNLYDNEIVICDVSCKNPNVMFELGMRLAFDKPTIIVIDDKTNFSFDTAPIEHLRYPRNLAYFEILRFKQKLSDKIDGTIQAAKEPGYTTFLKHFGEFKVADIGHKEGSMNEVILSRVNDVFTEVQRLEQFSRYRSPIEEVTIKRRKELLYDLINNEIDKYCEKNGVQKFDLMKALEDPDELKRLFLYVTRNKQIRDLGTVIDIREGITSALMAL